MSDLPDASAFRRAFVCDVQAVGDGVATLKYLSRYVFRTAITNHRIVDLYDASFDPQPQATAFSGRRSQAAARTPAACGQTATVTFTSLSGPAAQDDGPTCPQCGGRLVFEQFLRIRPPPLLSRETTHRERLAPAPHSASLLR